jgi:hypothetical protein
MLPKLAKELLPVSCSSSCAEPTSAIVLFPVVLLGDITPVPHERTMLVTIPIKSNILAATSLSILHTIEGL